MNQFDVEELASRFEAKLKTQLKAQIIAINSEKNDGIALDQIDDRAWCFMSLDEKVKNFNNFIFYDITRSQSQIAGPSVAKSYVFEVVVFVANKSDLKINQRILRYWRALEESIAKIWNSVDPGLKLEFDSLEPVDVQEINSSNFYKCIGVSVSMTFN